MFSSGTPIMQPPLTLCADNVYHEYITLFGYNMKTCPYVCKGVKSLEYSWVCKLHLQDTLFIELVWKEI